ncbi:MAG: hypothetical protein IJ079_07360 [Lachnospiraceae bacterium]|nr:hypothetical protein [Lachnospiraceae bacterium]
MMTKVNYNKNTQEDIQMALTYAMYMMLTSYFEHAECKTPLYEKKLYLRYMGQKVKDQYLLEDYCLQYLQNTLLSKYPKKFWNRKVEVRLTPNVDGKGDTILITDPHIEMKMTVEYQARDKAKDKTETKTTAKKKGSKNGKQAKKDTIQIGYSIRRGNASKRKRKEKAA